MRRASASTAASSSVSTLLFSHQHLAVHDRRLDVVAARDVDQVRHGVVERRLPRRLMPTMIRSARLPGSSDPIRRSIPSARAPPIVAISSAVAPAPRADRASRACAGTPPGASPRTCRGRCCWRRRRCRGRAPRRPPDTSATGAVPLASFMLLSGLCDTPTSCRFEHRDVLVGDPDAVRGQRRRAPEADRLEIAGRRERGSALASVLTSSSVSARWMSSGTLYFIASARHAEQGVLVERVHRVRRHRRHDQRVVLELLDEALGARQPLGRRLRVGDRELDDRLARARRAGPPPWSRCAISSSK